MANTSKAYVDAQKAFDKNELHEPAEAMALVKSLSKRNFDETVEVAFRLGIDPRKADQMLRGTVVAACRHRQEHADRGVRRGRRGRVTPRPRAPTSWAPTTS